MRLRSCDRERGCPGTLARGNRHKEQSESEGYQLMHLLYRYSSLMEIFETLVAFAVGVGGLSRELAIIYISNSLSIPLVRFVVDRYFWFLVVCLRAKSRVCILQAYSPEPNGVWGKTRVSQWPFTGVLWMFMCAYIPDTNGRIGYVGPWPWPTIDQQVFFFANVCMQIYLFMCYKF